jgi:AmiR/NasT family two-component response regulator
MVNRAKKIEPDQFDIMRAQGIIMGEQHCSATRAMDVLRARAHENHLTLAGAARAVIREREGRPPM